MMDPEVISFIRREIARHMNIILSGQSGTNTKDFETIENLLPGMPNIVNRPVMHPYGLVSRAPRGTIQVTARQGENPGNRMVLGHRDQKKPDVKQGEVMIYNQFGKAIYVAESKVHLGIKDAANPAVLGKELKAFLIAIINTIVSHTHTTTVPGSQTGPNTQGPDLTQKLLEDVQSDKMFSDLVFLTKE